MKYKLKMIKIPFLILLIFATFTSLAQKPEDYKHLLDKYKDKDYVVLDDKTTVEITSNKDKGVEIIKKENIRIYLTSDDAALFKKDRVRSSYFEKTLDIEAFALNKKGSRYKKSKVKDFETKETISNNVFYDDISVTNFEYEGLKKESIINLSYEVELTDPHLAISQIFGSNYPLLNKSLTVKVDNSIDIAISYFNMEQDDVLFTKEEGRNSTVYSWTQKDYDLIKLEPSSLSVRYFLPHVVVRIRSYIDSDGNTVNVLRDVRDLHNWYKSFLNEVTCDNEEELTKVLEKLDLSELSEKQKVKKVFEWVQNNIKYIAIEDGLGGFIPRNPDLVMNRRYGDCKDMATLIVQMLSMLDIEAHKVWIGTDEIPYTYRELPSPLVDNHMIAAYYDKEENEYIYLDGTDSKVTFGFPTQFIQGKEALIHKGDTFEIREVPIVPSIQNKLVDSVDLRIKDNMLVGAGNLTMTGYYAGDFKHHLSSVKTEESKKNQVRVITKKGSNKYKLTDYKIKVDETSLSYDYRFELSDYIFKNEGEIYINLNLDPLESFFNPYTEDRELDVKERYCSNTNYYFNLTIPEGYEVDYLPENVVIKNKDYDVRITYELVNENLLSYSLEIDLNYLVMDQERVSEIYEMGKTLKKAYNESIILKKINHEKN